MFPWSRDVDFSPQRDVICVVSRKGEDVAVLRLSLWLLGRGRTTTHFSAPRMNVFKVFA